ncbi:hypothetical protein THTE_0453 [Thermogutta terrifontis]|uniref:Uncharacterized protein n=1 Tax=Thermogutta terrifontis TaxID=1331910 RepID=A0A286RAR2_9BACT|nr:hypothetical protein THTE_0453 [Thermogutta terrifontis]
MLMYRSQWCSSLPSMALEMANQCKKDARTSHKNIGFS